MAEQPQNPTQRLRDITALFRKRMRAEDVIFKEITESLVKQGNDLFERIQRPISRLDLDQRGNVKQTDANLARVNQINDIIAKEVTKQSNQVIRELTNRSGELAGFYSDEMKSIEPGITDERSAEIIDSRQRQAVLRTNLDNIKASSSTLAQQVRRELNASLFEDIGPEQIADRLKKFIADSPDTKLPPLARHAETIARTSYNAYGNALAMADIDLDEVVAYHYSGPKDDANRGFCSARANKTHERKALEADIADQPGATIHNPGGWNCRHQLIPITVFDAEAEPFLTDEQRQEIARLDAIIDGKEPPTASKRKSVKKRSDRI